MGGYTMDTTRKEDKLSAGDWTYTLVKAGMSAVPIVGGPVAELFAALIAPPLTKR
jgi:hypothetical protein